MLRTRAGSRSKARRPPSSGVSSICGQTTRSRPTTAIRSWCTSCAAPKCGAWRPRCSAGVGGYNKGRSVPFNGPVELNVVPWVAGDLGTTLGVAAGAALAFQDEGSDRVCVCTFGDGTANRGDLHEALNLAACWRLPIVYVCQHNGWAISQASGTYLLASVADRAAGYGMPGVSVDGNDVESVRVALREAVARRVPAAGRR